MGTELTVATMNLHGGVDAWGRPFDHVAAASSLGADLLLLQEAWTPTGGLGQAQQIADATGASVHQAPLASGRRAGPHPAALAAWQRRRARLDGDHALLLDSERPLPRSLRRSERFRDAEPGSIGLAVVSRLPVRSSSVIDLGRLRRDRLRRVLLLVRIELEAAELVVGCVHLGHLTHGSIKQFAALRRSLGQLGGPSSSTILGGDLNLWGPWVSLQLPGWRRAVKEPTFPAWRPHSQLDHLLVGAGLRVIGGRAAGPLGSDHLALVARIRVGDRARHRA